jgi:hypothetical protein
MKAGGGPAVTAAAGKRAGPGPSHPHCIPGTQASIEGRSKAGLISRFDPSRDCVRHFTDEITEGQSDEGTSYRSAEITCDVVRIEIVATGASAAFGIFEVLPFE